MGDVIYVMIWLALIGGMGGMGTFVIGSDSICNKAMTKYTLVGVVIGAVIGAVLQIVTGG